MPFYLCEYIGDGTRAVPFRPALYDEAPGCSAIDIRPDASRLDGGGLNAALVFCPLDLAGPKWIKLGLDKLEHLSAARIQAIYTKLKIAARNAGARLDDILADLLITPPANGWNRLLPNRGFFEIWLGPRADKLLFKMATIGGGAVDTFTRPNENPIASPWTKLTGGTGTVQLLSNAMTAVDAGDKFYFYSGAVTSADQTCQFLYSSAIDNDDWGPACRIGVSGFSGYWLNLYAAGQAMSKFVAGSYTNVEAYTITVTTGTTYKVTAFGSTLSGFKGATEVTGSPSTDTSLATAGNGVGLFIFNINGSVDDFDGGDLGGGGGGSPTLVQIEHATGRGAFRGMGRGIR